MMTELNEDTIRAECRAWLEANWDPNLGLVDWRHKLAESGWGNPHWPSRWYGRDLPVGLVPIVKEEFARIGASAPPKPASVCWPPPRSWRTAPTCTKKSSCSAS